MTRAAGSHQQTTIQHTLKLQAPTHGHGALAATTIDGGGGSSSSGSSSSGTGRRRSIVGHPSDTTPCPVVVGAMMKMMLSF
jgi:hypothetical protein